MTDVSVLLDRTRFAQIWTAEGVCPPAARPGEDNCDNARIGNVKFLGERLEIVGNLSHFLNPVVAPSSARLQKLDVIHNDEIKAPLALQAPGACGPAARSRGPPVLVDIKGDALDLSRDLDQASELIFVNRTSADVRGGNRCLLGGRSELPIAPRDISREKKPNDARH